MDDGQSPAHIQSNVCCHNVRYSDMKFFLLTSSQRHYYLVIQGLKGMSRHHLRMGLDRSPPNFCLRVVICREDQMRQVPKRYERLGEESESTTKTALNYLDQRTPDPFA